MSLETGIMCPTHQTVELLFNSKHTRMNCPLRTCGYDVDVPVQTAVVGGPPGVKKLKPVEPITQFVEQVPQAVVAAVERAEDFAKRHKEASEAALAIGAGQLAEQREQSKLTKEERKAAAKRAVESVAPGLASPATVTVSKKTPTMPSARSVLELAMNAFVDGPVQAVGAAFCNLYLSSRNPAADSKEAVAALDACRVAFDACGLILADVETKKSPKAKVEVKVTAKKKVPAAPTKKKGGK